MTAALDLEVEPVDGHRAAVAVHEAVAADGGNPWQGAGNQGLPDGPS